MNNNSSILFYKYVSANKLRKTNNVLLSSIPGIKIHFWYTYIYFVGKTIKNRNYLAITNDIAQINVRQALFVLNISTNINSVYISYTKD